MRSPLLALARNIPQATPQKAGRWEREKQGSEVCNKVLGIIGLGNIGAIVADRALGLKMRVLAYDPFVSPETATKLRMAGQLGRHLRRADLLPSTPLTKDTRAHWSHPLPK
jgi:D-3-phosphoglycerate dehydrogenase